MPGSVEGVEFARHYLSKLSGRNDNVWNGIPFDLNSMLRKALLLLENWSAANFISHDLHVDNTVVRWNAPQYGRIKLNTDAAVDHNNNLLGFGWVLRDDTGGFLAAKNLSVRGLYGVKEAEAMSIREALSWVKDTGMGNVDVETDSLLVVNAISSPSFVSSFGLIIDDIKELASMIDDVEFRFVKRSANRAAHTIAREAVSMSGCGEWYDTPPLFLVSCLADDLMN